VAAFTVICLLMVLDKLGKGIVLRELLGLHACVILLLMPLLGYLVYNHNNRLSALWLRYMPIPENVYFSFALPAVTGFVFAVCWPVSNPPAADVGSPLRTVIDNGKEKLSKMPHTGLWLLIIGVSVFAVADFLPASLQFAFLLFYFSAFAGLLYVFFTPKLQYRTGLLVLFGLFIVLHALRSGMFTIVAYMGLTLFSFFFLGNKSPMYKKLIGFAVGVFILLAIQSVKQTYRKYTWGGNYEGNKAALFWNLIQQNIATSGLLSEDAFFPMYYRANEGFNVAMVMRRIPALQPYDNGENLSKTFASAFVPRLLWPDKPESGGKFNMKFYTGYEIEGFSTNVSPLGEAYGSFGSLGGIIYLILLGAFVRWAYRRVFIIANNTPLMIFWIPVLFYQVVYSMEGDTLQIMNSLTKSAFFIWVLTKFVPKWFGIVRKQYFKKPIVPLYQ
jgi:hypothetical protein